MGVAAAGWTVAHARSTAVQQWAPGGGSPVNGPPLGGRVIGDGQTVVVLLHGLLSSNGVYGVAYDQLADQATVVLPDLLGFAGSLDESLARVTLDDHLDALDETIDALGLSHRPRIVAGHSMGSLLALHWAARHPSTTEAVVAWSPPLYRSEDEAFDGIGRLAPMTRALSRDNRLARAICDLNCANRTASGLIAATMAPTMPTAVARVTSQHTWEAYRGAFDRVILDPSWSDRLTELDRSETPVHLVTGHHDRLLVPGRAADLATSMPSVTHEEWDGDHHLPLTHPDRAVRQIQRLLAG